VPFLVCLQVKTLALAETEAAAAILGKAERLIKSLAEQRQQQRQREVRGHTVCSSTPLLQQRGLLHSINIYSVQCKVHVIAVC
jgi:hypothetical protein